MLNDTRLSPAMPFAAAAQMMETWSRITLDWWRAQPARLFDENAPWNAGLYFGRRLVETMVETATRPVAITEEEREFRVEAVVPGVKPKDIDIRVSDGKLRISAEGDSLAADGTGGLRTDRHRLDREIPLPVNADIEKATAEVHNGKVTVIMPKQTRARDHKVTVKPA